MTWGVTCRAELCLYWTGQGCICEVMGDVPDLRIEPLPAEWIRDAKDPDPEPLDDVCGCCSNCDYCFCHWT